jgi:hypothetical protein
MNRMNRKEADLEKQRMQINREELIERMLRAADKDALLEVFPGVYIYHSSKPTECVPSVFKPAFCVIAQGSKSVLLNDESFDYDSGHYLISTLDLPIVSNVVEASREKPYLNQGSKPRRATRLSRRWMSARWTPICSMRWSNW